MQDLPASGSRKARTNTHQGLVTQSCRASGLHITHKPRSSSGPPFFVHFYNCNFHLISLCHLIADTSARSKQQILKTFAKLAEKADRQPVCIKLKLKKKKNTILMFLQMSHNCARPANFENIRGNRSKILLLMYCVIVGTVTSKGNNNFCSLF